MSQQKQDDQQADQQEYKSLKLIGNYKDEVWIGLIYKPFKGEKQMIYKIFLKNIYELEDATRDGVKEKIFLDHPFLMRTQEMDELMDKAIQAIFNEREEKIKESEEKIESEDLTSKEGAAAQMPNMKRK